MDEKNYIVYDGACPFCTRYVKLLRLQSAVGPVDLVDARSDHPAIEYLRDRQIDLDNGMAFIQNGQISIGHDCIHKLALLTTPYDNFNKLNALIFQSAAASRLLYPILRLCRNATLALLGRSKLSTKPRSS
ncbi:MAG: DCC1-like thiol-disulfide oxidoreductase family protein [Hyphomicrobiaceae bacterium]